MNTPRNDPRSAGAQSLKQMLIALLDAEDAACIDGDDRTPEPAQFVPIIEAALDEADGTVDAGFREGFHAALAEWLMPTVGGCVIGDPRNWDPLVKERTQAGGPKEGMAFVPGDTGTARKKVEK